MKYSVVIPVFNSEGIVGETIARTRAFFESKKLDFEIILVNDASPDGSWKVISDAARADARIKAVNLLRNYGQHNANLCGFRLASGDWLVTMDDDLQNPPEEILHLIGKAAEGHDLVIGRFRSKMHAGYRRLGTRVINWLNARIFDKPDGLVLSNFRLLHKDVVKRICEYQSPFPYIPGLALRFSGSPANVEVDHQPRRVGSSNYNFLRIAKLVATLLFNYSSFPLRFVMGLGLAVSALSFVLGVVFVIRGAVHGSAVQGWTSLVVLLAFFNGMLMLMVGMLGEYMVRLMSQTSGHTPYQIREIVDRTR
ncbi:MAG TPA: glycosyltransferase family 2 protein [Gammaproteobacteria bacterium]|jgi:glycosyltransferase involved in cell wall biosynthesis|nr:glycosyltransferase family 2 protein [Gammaproteobacteria bacterium]